MSSLYKANENECKKQQYLCMKWLMFVFSQVSYSSLCPPVVCSLQFPSQLLSHKHTCISTTIIQPTWFSRLICHSQSGPVSSSTTLTSKILQNLFQ